VSHRELPADPTITAILTVEREEPLVDLATVEALRTRAPIRLRLAVVDRLVAAQTLLPTGLRLLVVDGHRSVDEQVDHVERYTGDLRRANPAWPEDLVRRTALRRSEPADIASHVTGAAVDLTLCTRAGSELWLGTEIHTSPEATAGACYTNSTAVPPEPRALRMTLSQALTAVGMVNCPIAWWHWSHGDRYWAYVTGAPSAHYGPIVP
jgi:D-alanyl-D-alanine dipeptidase